MHNRVRWTLTCVSTLVVSLAISVRGADVAYDSAGDSAYNSVGTGTIVGLNGGYGWGGPWQTNPIPRGGAPTHVASAIRSGFINSPAGPEGRAWDLATHWWQGNEGNIIRPFSGALSAGQTFSIDFQNGRLTTPDEPEGLSLGGEYEIFPGDGGPFPSENGRTLYYRIYTQSGSLQTTVPVTDEGIHVDFSVLDTAHAQLSLKSYAPGGASDTVLVSYLPVSYMEIYNSNSTPGLPQYQYDYDVYFNNISITPEPSGFSVMAILAAGLLCRRRHVRLPWRARTE